MGNNLEIIVERHDVRIDNLEEYQKKQNGAIQKLADQYESLRSWLIAVLTAVILNLGIMVLNLIKDTMQK
jgi:prefoldin subunit 5